MAEKYMFLFLSRSIVITFTTSPDFGASGAEPSAGISAGVEIGGES
jgi:hypothetical protein